MTPDHKLIERALRFTAGPDVDGGTDTESFTDDERRRLVELADCADGAQLCRLLTGD
ncbi:MAG TPA: hypothetical protein VHD87_12940 [Acidimicrobiales bacterium]|nr:hypothetical protein [Acidimicrobiales bacterium]